MTEKAAARPFDHAVAWWLLGLINVVAVTVWAPEADRLVARATRHGVDLSRHLAAGVLSAAAYWGWQRFGTRRRFADLGALALTSLAIGAVVLSPDLRGIASRTTEHFDWAAVWPLQAALTAAVSLLIPVYAFALGWLPRKWRRLACVVMVPALYFVNATLSPNDNYGAHFYLTWMAALALGSCQLVPARVSDFIVQRSRGVWATGAVLVLLGLATFFVPLGNAARVDLTLWHTSIFPEVTRGRHAVALGAESRARGEFFAKREGLAPVPACETSPLPSDGLVILLTIDALRADVLEKKGKQKKFFPNIQKLREQGTYFTHARSPGSSTVYSLMALSTGRYFSQTRWTQGRTDFWPFEDESVHFPQLLSEAGVHTSIVRSAGWMEDRTGLMRGFQDRIFIIKDWKWMRGKAVADEMIKLLDQHHDGPAFFYAHFLDTHYPYWPGKKKGKGSFSRYLYALQYVDEQIGRIIARLEKLGVRDRSLIMVSADHGEAFGEHQSSGHAATLYEEVLRVPLVVQGPGVPHKNRGEAVGLIDLGPTILDLFEQPTPASFMGQSLVPLLMGDKTPLRRPIAAEARALRSMVFDDSIKVIHNRQRDRLEVYDLKEDPKEAHNLADELTPDQQARVQQTLEFFEEHAYREGGYEPPLRK